MRPSDPLQAAIVLPCPDLAEALAFFRERLGCRLEAIFPADDPRIAVVAGHGVRIRLQREGAASLPGELPPLVPTFAITRAAAPAAWKLGRAGMRYRDLVPDRQGGHLVASHIRIPEGGAVPDDVHFHETRVQLIYCRRGWVRVVYEDQGPPLVMREGDCVLQPPRIRHRVLDSSPGLEVVELACPAEHPTCIDHALELPTRTVRPDRDFGGQRFVHHRASEAGWARASGFLARDLGLAQATAAMVAARVLRRERGEAPPALRVEATLAFVYVLTGEATLVCHGQGAIRLAPDDCVVIPRGLAHGLEGCSDDLELLEVELRI